MRLLLAFLIFLLPEAHAGDGFRLKSQDKQLHMAAGYGCSLSSTLLLEKYGFSRPQAILMASAFTMLLGTGKELFIDNHYSPGDQWANLMGVGASAGFVWVFEF